MLFRYCLCLLGMLLALPLLVLIAFALTLPVSVSGIGYLLACSLVVIGLISVPSGGKHSVTIACLGACMLVSIAGIRLVLAGQTANSNLTVITLPQTKTRWIDVLIDEQDSLIVGEAIFHRIGGDSAREHDQIAAALQESYSNIRKTQRVFASPVISTYLNLQRPTSFDAVVIHPEAVRQPRTVVIFLHGSMGNVAAQCWEIAQAVKALGVSTVCPSTDWTGQWWYPEGQAILQATFQYLRGQGFETFYLGGFSNGGFGISRMASKLNREAGLRGLIFVDGIANGPEIRSTGLPCLIIQAANDERVPAGGVRQIAAEIGEQATYVELEGDHFIIMKHPEPVQNAITDWLEKQTTDK